MDVAGSTKRKGFRGNRAKGRGQGKQEEGSGGHEDIKQRVDLGHRDIGRS